MADIAPADERRRLKKQYAQMSEDELRSLAADAFDLTEAAQQALLAEITIRGLDIQLEKAPVKATTSSGGSDPPDFIPTVVHHVWDSTEALRVKKFFDEAGIPSYLGWDNLENFDLFTSGYDGGVEIKVKEEDSQRALKALAEWLPPEPGGDVGYAAHCPKCDSTAIVFRALIRKPRSPEAKFSWHCDACGHDWTDDGVEQ